MQYKQILSALTDLVVPKLLSPLTNMAIAQWYEDVCFNLQAIPWNITGTSIYKLQNTSINSDTSVSVNYKIRNEQLSKHLYSRLRDAKQDELIDELQETYSRNDGVSLLNAVYKGLMPKHTAQILQLLS